ncbi:hypothetical protein B566_EDAN008808 [Ephemera danica]|nr:hypothetical protein B566_EDAN008808 [Ephemera danica]
MVPTDASSTSKSLPRVPRKRETTGPSVQKYDQHRKSQPQKGKVFDKRPRSRGQYFTSGKEDSKVEEEIPELGSVLGNGSKKVNLNHLLNFHYTPKDGANYKHGRCGPVLQGCQFIVKASGDYTRYLNDPDMLVDWDLVEQIRVQSSELLSCPICLSSPTAARMTRCGHIFCWPCMLHYLALADKSWRKCPICYEAVHRDDLKSVVALCHAEVSVGEVVSMRLMVRERGTLVAVPVEQGDHLSHASGPAVLEDVSVSSLYCKLLVASKSQVLDILQHEAAELQQRCREEEGTPEICFTEQALELLGQRQASMTTKVETVVTVRKEEPAASEPDSMPVEAQHASIVYESAFDNVVQEATGQEVTCASRNRYESVSSEGQESVDSASNNLLPTEVENITPEDLETPKMLQMTNSNSKNSKYFYFYQASDGQHLYLHSLNARMLEATYGSLEAAPLTLKARIAEKEAGSMTAELRHRLRYLQHLPVTCQFEVVELDLRHPVVSKEAMAQFQDQLEQRRRKRQRRAKEEKRREKRIIEDENKRLGRYPTPYIKIESHYQFPECGIAIPSPKSDQLPGGFDANVSSPSISEEFKDLHIDTSNSGPSFAQMLREGKMQPTPRRQPAPPVAATNSDGEPDPEGYVPAPSFSQSFGDAFALALEHAAASSTPNTETSRKETSSKSGKKKKIKQKLLFSTTMACSSK